MTTPQNPPPAAPVPPPAGSGAGATLTAPKPSLLAAFKPEPSKAPPIEWVALGVGLLLAISGVLPWITAEGVSFSGLDITDGWIVLGSGIASMVMGFVGLSRDSISLALGQALTGLVCLVAALLNMSPGEGLQAGFGLYAALVISIVLIGLSIYNAYDAFRKGAKY